LLLLPLENGCSGSLAGLHGSFLLTDGSVAALADERVSTELKKQIVQARTAKKLTQAQLGQVRNCCGA
jgi:hypothetical protein